MIKQNDNKIKKIKICGIKNQKILNFLITNSVDYFGLIFYKNSPRFLKLEQAYKLIKIAQNSKIEGVGVFVNSEIDMINQYIKKLELKYIQLHGNEDYKYIEEIKNINKNIKIIKAIGVNTSTDIKKTKKFSNADYFLFDYKPKIKEDLPGGNAKKFNWEIIRNLKISKSWFLSGGINEINIKNALNIKNVYSLDISSGVEDKPGIKNIKKIRNITNFVKKYGEY